MPYPILDPTGTTATAPRAPHAPRRRDLRGATVGLLVNTKQNAAPFLDEVGRLLVAEHGATGPSGRARGGSSEADRRRQESLPLQVEAGSGGSPTRCIPVSSLT